jgi:predicted metalloprotease
MRWQPRGRSRNLEDRRGVRAGTAVGDDRLQRAAGATVQPESFTHGSSSQRMEWFRRGFDSGDPGRCDTFGAP